MFNFLIDFIATLLDQINDNEDVRDFVRNLGKMFASLIPGKKIEPQLIEFLDLFKEGVLEHQIENSDNEESEKKN